MVKIKQLPEDFVVREIFEKQPHREGWKTEDEAYIWCDLTKRNYDLFRALKFLSRRLGVSPKRFGYAGTKDKRAVTTQKISVWNVPLERLQAVRLKDIELSNFEEARERITLGDLKANEFEITVRDIEEREKKAIEHNLEKINKKGFINLFGEQRFGNRNNTHLVGREILRGNLKEAVWMYLAGEGDNDEEINAFRKQLRESGDVKEALKNCPRVLRNELIMLNHLVHEPSDYAGALRRLPKKMRTMLVHAYQSYLWNEMARACDEATIPLVGIDTNFSKYTTARKMREIMDNEGVKSADFKIDSMPELSCEGAERERIAVAEKMQWNFASDELNAGKIKCILRFAIPKGSYATVLIDEVFA
ncbi:MAG: tRNA pseudouridine(13) synthase TruD [Candidatus Aenigmarchaeota archaeon]|nr:tRNA pseudouridine(13) synthase TruD [Candidatus Aenigmarchaeota archaeon]